MTFREAEQFLSATQVNKMQPSAWADLGCGSGLFSQVLSSKLCSESVIHAIDKTSQSTILSANKEVRILFQKADFVKDELPLQHLNGILMANAIHYVEDKKALLQKLKTYLLPTGMFILIEYENARANRWVPYPVSFSQATNVFAEAGFFHIEKTGERRSVYQSGKMYVCTIKP